jgi:hypothetical protein
MATDVRAEIVFMIPGDAPDPAGGKIGRGLEMPYTVIAPLPQRTLDDVVMSIQKHLAEVLAVVGVPWLTGLDAQGDPVVSPSWEVRLWDEQSSFRLPFARVAAVGPDTVTGRTPLYADHSQSISIHLYPHPAQDSERAVLGADRLRAAIRTRSSSGPHARRASR